MLDLLLCSVSSSNALSLSLAICSSSLSMAESLRGDEVFDAGADSIFTIVVPNGKLNTFSFLPFLFPFPISISPTYCTLLHSTLPNNFFDPGFHRIF